jgi:hypothetical protein
MDAGFRGIASKIIEHKGTWILICTFVMNISEKDSEENLKRNLNICALFIF